MPDKPFLPLLLPLVASLLACLLRRSWHHGSRYATSIQPPLFQPEHANRNVNRQRSFQRIDDVDGNNFAVPAQRGAHIASDHQRAAASVGTESAGADGCLAQCIGDEIVISRAGGLCNSRRGAVSTRYERAGRSSCDGTVLERFHPRCGGRQAGSDGAGDE